MITPTEKQKPVQCPKCGRKVMPKLKTPEVLPAHVTKPGGTRWCSNGEEPTTRQRDNAYAGHGSVRTVSGGLPSLGKR